MGRSRRYVWHTASPGQSRRLGEAIGRRIHHGVCVSIVGPLGAGKTVMVAGLCRGLGVSEDVLSPSFVLLEEFAGRLPVAHVDLYRMEHEREIEELGVFDSLGGSTVILVEWGDRSEWLSTHSDAVINLVPLSQSDRRVEVTCTPQSSDVFEGVEL